MRPNHEMHPNRLRPRTEPAEPAAHRQRRQTQLFSDRSHTTIPTTRRLQDQRQPDHPNTVTTPTETVATQQNMRLSASAATSTTRSTPLHHSTLDAHHPRTRPPPTNKNTLTLRATNPALHKIAFDYQRIGLYHDHRCLQHHSKDPPGARPRTTGGSSREQGHPHAAAPNPNPPTRAPSPRPMSLPSPNLTTERDGQQPEQDSLRSVLWGAAR